MDENLSVDYFTKRLDFINDKSLNKLNELENNFNKLKDNFYELSKQYENKPEDNVESKQIKLDVEGLQKRMNDPKEVEMYRRTKFLAEKGQKQQEIFKKYKQNYSVNTDKLPLARDVYRLMRIDGSQESENFNRRLVNFYIKHPNDFAIAVSKGTYSADSSVYNGILMDDYERCKVYCDNFENVMIAWNEAFLKTNFNDKGMVNGLDGSIMSNLCQEKTNIVSGFTQPENIFGAPKMTAEQLAICAVGYDKEYTPEYADIVTNSLVAEQINTSKENVQRMKEKGILDDKEPMLTFKAIEVKNGKEKEIDLIKACASKDPNVKIVRRTEQEKEKLRYITVGNYRRQNMDEVKNNMEKFKEDFVNAYKGKNANTRLNTFNQDMILDENKGGFFERRFDTTSKEYKDFVEAFKKYTDEKSPDFGDHKKLVNKAKDYIKHKNVTDERSIEKLDKTGRNRVKFCQAIIEAVDKQPELLINVKEEPANNPVEQQVNLDNKPLREQALTFDDVDIEKNNIQRKEKIVEDKTAQKQVEADNNLAK